VRSPWLIRTYAGHSTAKASNALYRGNLAKGQTGLSVAFDLPTQTGYDSDHVLARGEVGKVGVPICHLGDMRTLFDEIPLEQMNTSMTINATAPWLLALYIAVAEEQGADVVEAARHGAERPDQGIPEPRHLYLPARSPRCKMIADVAEYCYTQRAEMEPDERVFLPPAGGRRDAGAGTGLCAGHRHRRARRAAPAGAGRGFPGCRPHLLLRECRHPLRHRDVQDARLRRSLGRDLRERYGVEDPKFRRFRYGVQVNSLGLTEQQPENNVYRILIEMLAVTLSKKARARAVQLPAWNEALGLPRPWDQQWSMRMQQILAYETDLLEYGDLFDGNPAVDAKVEELKAGARAELANLDAWAARSPRSTT
jgi:(2R)-ethylmalonyl-CoA mutase